VSVQSPVGIVGLGLMGGSLARALTRTPDAPEIVAWSRTPEDLARAREEGVISHAAERAEEVAEAAALLVYAVPLGAILDMIDAHRSIWRTDAVITDVASLKVPVLERVRAVGAQERFVGSHPMTGGEASGFAASRADLYRDVPVWITKDTGNRSARVAVESLWTTLGARPWAVSAEAHDRRMVWVSHLPQLTANALARVLEGESISRDDLGPGGRDMTRLAASSPAVWIDLLTAAGPEVVRSLEALARAIEALTGDLRDGSAGEVTALMEATRRWHGGPAKPHGIAGSEDPPA
jgi:prephenate dehydrogenase